MLGQLLIVAIAISSWLIVNYYFSQGILTEQSLDNTSFLFFKVSWKQMGFIKTGWIIYLKLCRTITGVLID